MSKMLLVQKHARVWAANKDLVLHEHVMKADLRVSPDSLLDRLIDPRRGPGETVFRLNSEIVPIPVPSNKPNPSWPGPSLLRYASVGQLLNAGYKTIATENPKWPWLIIPKERLVSINTGD